MHAALISIFLAMTTSPGPLPPGNHNRSLQVDGLKRSYLVHVPPKYDPKKSTPIVLVLHGAWTNGPITAIYCGLNRTADENGFVTVYPNGTGVRDTLLFWNSGGQDPSVLGREPADDVKFIGALLDDLGTVIPIDSKRIFATGISNGGMMCYRLAAEMSDRIAAIAPISGTVCLDECHPKRPVSILHFHGTDDKLVPYDGSRSAARDLLHCKSVDETMRIWAKLDGCIDQPKIELLPNKVDDGTKVRRHTFGLGKDNSEVVLMEIEGGGHTWPGRPLPPGLEAALGKSTGNISANAMIWDFFQRHPLP
jgi:polyhydroxybutyrate depolymerase